MPFWGTQSGSHMQWCHAIQILVVHIGAVGQQVIHHLQIAEIHRILGPVVAIWKYTNEWKGNVDTPSGVCQSLCIYMISCYAAVSNSRPVTFQSKCGTCPYFQWEYQGSKHRRCCWSSLDLKSQNSIFRMFNNPKFSDAKSHHCSIISKTQRTGCSPFSSKKCPLKKLHEFLHFQGTCNGQKWGSPSNFTRALMSAFASLMSPRCIKSLHAVSNTVSFGLKDLHHKKVWIVLDIAWCCVGHVTFHRHSACEKSKGFHVSSWGTGVV